MNIYKITNLINGKIYIGKDVRDRQSYFGSGTLVQKAIKKYRKQNFKKEILERCESKKRLSKKEIYWIKRLNSKTPIGYNMTDGGEGNLNGGVWNKGLTKNTDMRLKKTSEKLKGHISWNKGLTKETDERLLKTSKSAQNNKKFMKHASEMGKANKGKKKLFTKKHCENLSIARTNWWNERKQLQGI